MTEEDYKTICDLNDKVPYSNFHKFVSKLHKTQYFSEMEREYINGNCTPVDATKQTTKIDYFN
jgi:hypothetical protein